MNTSERQAMLEEVRLASSCSHPIRLRGSMVDLETGELSTRLLRVACKDRREALCPACSSLYKADAWILIAAGMFGGKGIDESVVDHPKLFVTLTAPSFGTVHTLRADGSCHKTPPKKRCSHGVLAACTLQHRGDDPVLGDPLCAECFDYRGAVLWNGHASRLFSETVRQLKRRLASGAGIPHLDFVKFARINYLKVAEVQRRGLIHFHAVVRADGPDHASSGPPDWLGAEEIARELRVLIPDMAVRGVDGRELRWGRQFDVSILETNDEDPVRVGSYLAKYSVKTTDGSRHFARRFDDRGQILRLPTNEHRRQLALAAWDLGQDLELRKLRLRLHAHAFGFTGQLITKSRGFTSTFSELRAARAAYMARSNSHLVVSNSFRYLGRGYDDPRSVELAEVFFAMDSELRAERAQARRKALEAPGDLM